MRKQLTDLCTIQYGYAFDSESFTTDNSFPPLVRIRDVKRGFSETFYSGDYPPEYVIHSGDLLVGMDGEFNIARWRSGDALLNQRVCKISATRGTDEEYLRFALQKALKEIEDRTAFVTVKHLSAKELNKLELDIPDMGEQARIAQILCKLERVISMREAELSALDDLIKARFVEMFGDLADPACVWQTCRLVDSCGSNDDIKCGPFGTQLSKDEYQSNGVPVWEIPQINSAFAIPPEHFLTEAKAKELQAYTLTPGDIVMSRKGNVGKCALFPEDKESGVLHSDVLRIRVSVTKANPCFMMYQLHYSRDVIRQIEQVSSGAIMAGVNVTKLKEILVKLPPLGLQEQFAAFVAQIDKSKSVIQKSLDETQLLFDSLMQQYFG